MVDRILIAGYGAMTGAMVDGWLASGVPASAITAFDPFEKPVPPGVTFVTDVPSGPFDAIVLGFKPQSIAEAAPPIEPLAGPETTVISVLAGVELASLSGHFPRAGAVVRLMPNLAAALGKSPNALVAGPIDPVARDKVTDLAARLGSAEWLADENLADLVMALAGSGPGFVYRFIDALAAGATRLGLDAAQAQRLAVAMVEGAGALAAASPLSPGELARKVASPGGMTQKGLDVLDEGEALTRLVCETLRAARDRGREMAAAARGDG
ncbi:Pyrroline-5-carboxylate reductase [Tsuneonella dongtanensis]|uniref:Pyrroline-5-carboxylate reductase n=1 Tax=Tsuneonella dongtanensis TaxID=692370 RepID=A0A1B2AD58_9SPHN|nr:pyrroline-5-carboxylate reductase [Tsuneonella dongtanensis]ANY20028.1 Pyrroline-5-carboxylate reductase [Tsuneonella dongtanensis]